MSSVFRASETGILLGKRGLAWTDNADFQEVTRRKTASQQRFWVHDMPVRLRKILDSHNPVNFAIKDKAVLAIFHKWAQRRNEKMPVS